MTKHKSIILTLIGILFVGFSLILFLFISNPWNAMCIGDIPTPVGYTRLSVNDPYTEYLRGLPLQNRGALVHLYNGKIARLQFLSAGVIDMPVLSQYEQCADMVIRIRAEHLWQTGQYEKICFRSVTGKDQHYSGGNSRKEFESYLRNVYGHSNTESVFKETRVRDIKDIRPGDVLVYPSRRKGRYGHAVLVADVARNKSGKIAILCVEGNTPAREAHVVRNMNPIRNPWFIMDGDEDEINVNVFKFKKKELRYYLTYGARTNCESRPVREE